MDDSLTAYITLFVSTGIIGLGIGTILSKFHLPYIWNHPVERKSKRHGGELVAEVLHAHGVKYIFTLPGGHISPIIVASEKLGIRIVDTRHEVAAVFAADAVARLSGTVGVAAVTAGPGLTNTVTAVKNAQMAESPLLLIGGAAASILKGRGALQDIDQMSLFKPLCKYYATVTCIRDIIPTVLTALKEAQSGTPAGTNVAQTFKEYSSKQEFNHWGEAKIMDDELDPQWLAVQHEKLDKQFGKGIITVKYTDEGSLGYYCELCFSTMNNLKPLQAHCSGMKHLKKKDIFEKSIAAGEQVLVGRSKDANILVPPPKKPNPKKDKAPSRNDWDRYPRDERDRPPRGDWGRYPNDDFNRYPRDDRDRFPRDDRDRFPRDDRDRYPRDDRDRYPRDGRDRAPDMRTEQDRYGREPWGELDRRPRDEWDRRSADKDNFDRREVYDYRNRQASPPPPYADKRPRLDTPDSYSRNYGERERLPLRVPTPPRAAPSPPRKAAIPDSTLSGGPAAALLTTLSQCSVKNEEDASLASEVIELLLRSLKDYNMKNGEESVANLMEQAEIKLGTAKAIKSAKKVTTQSMMNPVNPVTAALETLRQGSLGNLPKFSSLI